jgi:arsenate reductase-like glutaredoxin family protein
MKITIYSTTDCAACHSLTAWLSKLGYAYDLHIVDTDPKLMAEFITIADGKLGVPFSVLIADDGTQTKISGFDVPKFKAILAVP